MFNSKKINIFYLFAILWLVYPVLNCGTPEDRPEAELREMPFETTYVGVDVIRELLDQPDCVGIRFYNASKTSDGSNIGLVAVGIRVDSSEIFGEGTANYRMIEPKNQNGMEPDPVARDVAKRYAENVKNWGQVPSYSAVFYREEIRELCPGWRICTGFELEPTTNEDNGDDYQYNMLMMVMEEGEPTGYEAYIVSSAPCPPICPDSNKLLIEPSLEPISSEDEDEDEDSRY